MTTDPSPASTRESLLRRALRATLLGLLASSFVFAVVRWLWRPFFSAVADSLWLILALVGPAILIALVLGRFRSWPRWVAGLLAAAVVAGVIAMLVPKTPLLWVVAALFAAAAGALLAPALERDKGLPIAFSLIILFAIAGMLAPSPYRAADASSKPRVIMVGLDGANWQIIDELTEAGHLPVMNRIRREGATGVLMSNRPTFSPRVWTTIATAVPSEQHGIDGFLLDPETSTSRCRGCGRSSTPRALTSESFAGWSPGHPIRSVSSSCQDGWLRIRPPTRKT